MDSVELLLVHQCSVDIFFQICSLSNIVLPPIKKTELLLKPVLGGMRVFDFPLIHMNSLNLDEAQQNVWSDLYPIFFFTLAVFLKDFFLLT